MHLPTPLLYLLVFHHTKQNKERDQFSKLKSWPPRSPQKSANFLASCNLGAVDGARSGRALLSPSIPLQRYCNFAIHLPAFLARFDFSTSGHPVVSLRGRFILHQPWYTAQSSQLSTAPTTIANFLLSSPLPVL